MAKKKEKKNNDTEKNNKLVKEYTVKKHVDCTFTCSSCGYVLHTKSIEKEMKADICSNCHPFYNGKKTSNYIGKAKEFSEKIKRMEQKRKK